MDSGTDAEIRLYIVIISGVFMIANITYRNWFLVLTAFVAMLSVAFVPLRSKVREEEGYESHY